MPCWGGNVCTLWSGGSKSYRLSRATRRASCASCLLRTPSECAIDRMNRKGSSVQENFQAIMKNMLQCDFACSLVGRKTRHHLNPRMKIALTRAAWASGGCWSLKWNVMQCTVVQRNVVQCNVVSYNTMQRNVLECNGMKMRGTQWLVMQCNVL